MKHHPSFSLRWVYSDALASTFLLLNPLQQIRNPVLFVVYVGALLITVNLFYDLFNRSISSFDLHVAFWIWFTVLAANFAHSIAESFGRAHASTLRKVKDRAQAHIIVDGIEHKIDAQKLKIGDTIICKAGEVIPVDGEVIAGIATVDESAITGESAPVIRESGGDLSAVTAGTMVLSDSLTIAVSSEVGYTFLDRVISLIEGGRRQPTANEIALNMILSAMSLLFLLVAATLKVIVEYITAFSGDDLSVVTNIPVLTALLVCLIPTTVGSLLSAVSIAGMGRLVRKNVIVKSGRAIEAASDIDLLLLDKTGTITIGNRMATAFLAVEGYSALEVAKIALWASLSDETPEGRSIVELARELYGLERNSLPAAKTNIVPFSAKTRLSGIDFLDDHGAIFRSVRKGAAAAVRQYVEKLGGRYSPKYDKGIVAIARQGGTPLLVCDNSKIVGLVHLKDIVKAGLKERFLKMRKMNIRTSMITGDNPLTAAAIAIEAGVDDFLAEVSPQDKLTIIKEEQKKGHFIAMTGDGINDAPALAQADVGVAMNTGTQASREAGNMVDLDNNPTKLIDIIEISKQMLMTRGALTTFSIVNDVAKYFALIPALFGYIYANGEMDQGPLAALNIMDLHSYRSAILSTVIFNAVTIIALVPLALRGVPYKLTSANSLLKRNISIYGLGGLILPFIAIKGIDLILLHLGLML